jgi:rare lipoprotein A
VKTIVAALLSLAGLNAAAAYSHGSFAEDQFMVIAGILAGATYPERQQLDQRSLDQYSSIGFSAVDTIKAIEKSKCRRESGVASWYGGYFQGRKTANGERFNTYAASDLTAAHRTLPMGTRVRVTNRSNGLSIVVRINDRGPYIHGRVIDVTHEGAKALHLDGVGRVQLSCI